MARLDGKVAVITGGSSGIGLASAQRFVEEGAYVFITGRRQSELGKVTEENFDLTFDLNARAALFTVQKALPLMREGGSVILVGSVAGYVGINGYSTYSATKAALRSYVRTWTREFGDRGIRFNTLSPGPIDTPIMDAQASTPEEADQIRATFAAAIPLNRMGRAEEIAAAALFLASDDSSFVAGTELSVDGGFAQV
jgi:NAD(P)-dependent dehydrogenase (short-subunit alcohol dehydrogenase family)